MIRLLVTSGRGPVECRIAVAGIVPLILAEAEEFGLGADRIDGTWSDRHGPASAVVMIHGAEAEVFGRRWIGSVQWIALSPIRPRHRRKNWFVGIFDLEPVGAGRESTGKLSCRKGVWDALAAAESEPGCGKTRMKRLRRGILFSSESAAASAVPHSLQSARATPSRSPRQW